MLSVIIRVTYSLIRFLEEVKHMDTKITEDSSQKQSLRDAIGTLRANLHNKLDELSSTQINSVWQFVESLECQNNPIEIETPTTNEEIGRIIESYRQQNKLLPLGLAKGEFVVPDDFNEPLPDEILDLFEPQ
jgi:peptidoglycan hydrolase CwlO-like protein